jgi:hypothetical protein
MLLLVLVAASAVVAMSFFAAPAVRGNETTLRTAPLSNLTGDEAIDLITAADGTLRFDVAEDATRFLWSGEPALTAGKPANGTPYVTQGYIYPEGTLTESNGVLPDGSPEFPDKVIGLWSCYGWWVGDAAHAQQTAPWITTHLFNFGGAFGETTLVSEGFSIDELSVPLERAIVGGTGAYVAATGVQRETNLGFNATDGVNVRYEVRLADR